MKENLLDFAIIFVVAALGASIGMLTYSLRPLRVAAAGCSAVETAEEAP